MSDFFRGGLLVPRYTFSLYGEYHPHVSSPSITISLSVVWGLYVWSRGELSQVTNVPVAWLPLPTVVLYNRHGYVRLAHYASLLRQKKYREARPRAWTVDCRLLFRPLALCLRVCCGRTRTFIRFVGNSSRVMACLVSMRRVR